MIGIYDDCTRNARRRSDVIVVSFYIEIIICIEVERERLASAHFCFAATKISSMSILPQFGDRLFIERSCTSMRCP